MNSANLNLIDIIKVLMKKFKFIAIFTFITIVAGYIFAKVQKKEYTSKVVFIVKTPKTFDRSFIFQKEDYYNIDYFADEDELDNVVTILGSYNLLNSIVRQFDLQNYYQQKSLSGAINKYKKNYKYKRNSTKSMEVAVSDPDPVMAQKLAAATADSAEKIFQNYFLETQKDFVNTLELKIQEIDENLIVVDDSIMAIRKEYNVYDQLLPIRSPIAVTQNAIPTTKAEGMEKMEKFTSQKEKMLKDRGIYTSLLNENKVNATSENIRLFYHVENAQVEDSPSWPITWFILFVCAIAGFIFSCLLVLLQDRIRAAE